MTAPKEPFAAAARAAIEAHTEWDAPHAFVTLHWDGASLATRTYACIMADINPADYPKMMAGMALEELSKDPADPAYAYLLQAEFFGVTEPGPDATEADREQFDRDRLGRTFHQRPDAIECATAWVADVHGRVWNAGHTRKDPGLISEKFYPPGRAPSGHFVQGLLAVAYTTGVLAHGLPGPQGRMN